MRTTFRIALIAGACAAALTPAIASHSWGTYHWASNGRGVDLTINRAITPAWSNALAIAVTDWEKSRKLSLTARDAAGVNRKRCSPILGEILVCNDSYGQRGWLGIASIWLSNGHIVQGTTQLNDTYFDMDRYNTAAWRTMVACQEVGHDFGLDHQDEVFGNVNLGTCMDYSSNPEGGIYNGFDYGPSNEHPNSHDYSQLTSMYGHNDGASTAATDFGVREVGKPAAQPASSAPAGLGPAEWGRAVRNDAQGRPNMFEKQIAPGQKVITHVLWAIGEGPQR